MIQNKLLPLYWTNKNRLAIRSKNVYVNINFLSLWLRYIYGNVYIPNLILNWFAINIDLFVIYYLVNISFYLFCLFIFNNKRKLLHKAPSAAPVKFVVILIKCYNCS